MDKKAVISIISNASVVDGEQIEVISPGTFMVMENGYKIVYEETELSGMEGTTTSIMVREDEVVLEREGTTTTKMIFNESEPAVALYNTPYGMLELTITTERVYINMEENGGELEIEYDMSVAGQEPISTTLSLKVKTK